MDVLRVLESLGERRLHLVGVGVVGSDDETSGNEWLNISKFDDERKKKKKRKEGEKK